MVNKIVMVRDGVEVLDFLFGTRAMRAATPGLCHQVVLLDLKLPKIDGLEVLKRVRADPRTKLLPVVILTSSKEEHDLIKGYSLGANSYIRKPVDFTHFAEAVQHMELYGLVLNEQLPTKEGFR